MGKGFECYSEIAGRELLMFTKRVYHKNHGERVVCPEK